MNDKKDANQEAAHMLNELTHKLEQNKKLLDRDTEQPNATASKPKEKDAENLKEDKKTMEQPITLQAIYIKDFSFESPNTPGIFEGGWEPEVDLRLENKHRRTGEDIYEAVLHIKIGCKQAKNYAFFIEIQQAGLFRILGFNKNQIEQVLSTFCADLLFPYARSTIDNILLQGGFPALKLSPINFLQIYQESLQKKQQELDAAKAKA